jgi:glyoxalase-like protein
MVDRFVQAIVLVTDLTESRRRMEELGLTVLEGGRHPGRGTANVIVPFGDQYLELLAVVDRAEAESSPQGRPVLEALARGGPGLARWSVEPDDIDAISRRIGHPIERRQRVRPDGTTVRWRSVAVDAAWSELWRCAFMAWDDPTTHPAHAPAVHGNGATGFDHLEVVVPDQSAALTWLGGQIPDGVDIRVGPVPGVTHLSLSSPSGPITIA